MAGSGVSLGCPLLVQPSTAGLAVTPIPAIINESCPATTSESWPHRIPQRRGCFRISRLRRSRASGLTVTRDQCKPVRCCLRPAIEPRHSWWSLQSPRDAAAHWHRRTDHYGLRAGSVHGDVSLLTGRGSLLEARARETGESAYRASDNYLQHRDYWLTKYADLPDKAPSQSSTIQVPADRSSLRARADAAYVCRRGLIDVPSRSCSQPNARTEVGVGTQKTNLAE